MQISNEFPQFENETAVLLVTGGQTLECYIARGGNIEKRKDYSFETPNPHYSDDEGFFKRQGKKMIFGWGAPREFPKEKVRKEFLGELEGKLAELEKEVDVDQVFLFAPDYNMKLVRKRLPKKMQQAVNLTFEGDFNKQHPFKLLEKITAAVAEKKEARSPAPKDEARKILEKARQAKEAVGRIIKRK